MDLPDICPRPKSVGIYIRRILSGHGGTSNTLTTISLRIAYLHIFTAKTACNPLLAWLPSYNDYCSRSATETIPTCVENYGQLLTYLPLSCNCWYCSGSITVLAMQPTSLNFGCIITRYPSEFCCNTALNFMVSVWLEAFTFIFIRFGLASKFSLTSIRFPLTQLQEERINVLQNCWL